MQRIPQVWPGWKADELIGQGAYGKVYRASRTLGGNTSVAAIKVIDIPSDESEVEALRQMNMDAMSIRSYFEETARRVVDEVATMERLKGSPHVVHIEDYQLLQREDGVGWTVFIRMELLQSLEEYQRANGLPDVREVARIGIDICDALVACHNASIIHRDVKPANVFVSQYGDYKLGDFGVAKRLDEATHSTKSYAGTDTFMAPEVPTGHYDETVDVYSLGIMLYRWLNGGRPPFLPASGSVSQADVQRARQRRLAGERPPMPAGKGVPNDLARIVRKACEPAPTNRWRSAAGFGKALQAWLDGEPASVDMPVGSIAAETSSKTSDTTGGDLSALGRVAAAVEQREAEEARKAAEEAAKKRAAEEAKRKAEQEAAKKRADEEAERKAREAEQATKAATKRRVTAQKGTPASKSAAQRQEKREINEERVIKIAAFAQSAIIALEYLAGSLGSSTEMPPYPYLGIGGIIMGVFSLPWSFGSSRAVYRLVKGEGVERVCAALSVLVGILLPIYFTHLDAAAGKTVSVAATLEMAVVFFPIFVGSAWGVFAMLRRAVSFIDESIHGK